RWRSRSRAVWFRSEARLRSVARAENRASERDTLDLSVLFGELRRHYLHDRRPRQERHAASRARRGRPRPPHQSRYAVPEGRIARTRHPERAALAEATSAPTRRNGLGRYFMGRGDQRNRSKSQENAGRNL